MATTRALTEETEVFRKSSDTLMRELTQRHQALSDSIERLIRFQRQTLTLKNSDSIDSALDIMELLLVEILDFTYTSLQYRDENGVFTPIRQICPENMPFDYKLMEWVMSTQELSLLPIDAHLEEENLRSLLFLPFGPRHLMLLWFQQEPDAFTREQEVHLTILSREMAAVLDAHYYRVQIDKARAAMSDIIESVPLGLVALDCHKRVQMINSTAEIALGVRRQDAVGADSGKVLPQQLVQLISSQSLENAIEEAEVSNPMPGREDQFLGVTISRIRCTDDFENSGLVVVCRDLQLSREVQKLRELDKMKSDFLSLVTHELRTPLTSIVGLSEALNMDDSDNVPQQWREYLDTIHSEGTRLSRLVDDIIDLTRMEAGKMDYQFENQDPNEIIGSVIMSMTPQLEAKNHQLECDLGEDLGECRIAPDRFTQALINVFSNAIRYTNPGGVIRIASRRADPFPGAAVPTILVTVEDNGIGIPPENMDKVFSKFEIGESVRHHTSGTGLSMSICKQIIEEGHGGRIWLESEVGKMTRVYIQIPVS